MSPGKTVLYAEHPVEVMSYSNQLKSIPPGQFDGVLDETPLECSGG